MANVRKYIAKFALLLAATLIFFSLTGFTGVEGELSLKTSGKSTLTLVIESEKSQEALLEEINARILFYTYKSGDTDMIVLKSCKKTAANRYEVKIKLRRIDNIQAYGTFDWKKFSDYNVEESENRTLLERFAVGNLSCTIAGYYNGKEGKVTISRTSRLQGDSRLILPRDVTGREMELEELFEQEQKNAKKDTIFLFRIVDFEGLVSAKITLPGKIKYYAGNDIRVSGKTIELKPSKIEATVTYFESGSDVPLSENRDVDVMVGYVIFDKDLSPLAVALIVIACVAVTAGILLFVWYCRKVGKAVIEKEEQQKALGKRA